MPFEERTKVDLRESMVVDVVENGYSISEAARKYGVTRPTVRSWVKRFESGGREALADRSHAPNECPHKTPALIEQLILKEKRKFGWGAKKLRNRLVEQYPELVFPSIPTCDRILASYGLVEHRKRRARSEVASPFCHQYKANLPGELLTGDFMGQFRMKNGRYCYALTLFDRASHFILACKALRSTHLEPAWNVILRVLREHGLPDAMQTDNGPPFGAPNGQFSTLSVRLMKLDITPVFSRPANPQDNGSHERKHRDLKRETTRPPGYNLSSQQRLFDRFVQSFNHERPHESLEMNRPARVYTGGRRPFPSKPILANYPAYFETRLVSTSGSFKWGGHRVFISHAFAGETIALEPTDDGVWTVHFRRFMLGKFDERRQQFH